MASVPGVDQRLRSDVSSVGAAAALLLSVTVGPLRFDGGPLAGAQWFQRRVGAPGFIAIDASVGPSVGARFRVTWSRGWLGLSLSAEARAVWLARETLEASPWFGVTLDASWSPAR